MVLQEDRKLCSRVKSEKREKIAIIPDCGDWHKIGMLARQTFRFYRVTAPFPCDIPSMLPIIQMNEWNNKQANDIHRASKYSIQLVYYNIGVLSSKQIHVQSKWKRLNWIQITNPFFQINNMFNFKLLDKWFDWNFSFV